MCESAGPVQVTAGPERDATLVEDLIAFKDQMDAMIDVAFQRRQAFQHTLQVRHAMGLRMCAYAYWGCACRSVAVDVGGGGGEAPAVAQARGERGGRNASRLSSMSGRTSPPSSWVRVRGQVRVGVVGHALSRLGARSQVPRCQAQGRQQGALMLPQRTLVWLTVRCGWCMGRNKRTTSWSRRSTRLSVSSAISTVPTRAPCPKGTKTGYPARAHPHAIAHGRAHACRQGCV
jgi:hypothetical protein